MDNKLDNSVRHARRIGGGDEVEVFYNEENGVCITSVRPYHHPFTLDWRWILRATIVLALVVLLLPVVFYLGSSLRETINTHPNLASLRPVAAYFEGIFLIAFGLFYVLILPLLHLQDLVHLIREMYFRTTATIRDHRDRCRGSNTLQSALDEAYAKTGVPTSDETDENDETFN